MQTDIIVAGACGRMGATICKLARESADLRLVGLLEHPQYLDKLAGADCPVSDTPETLLQAAREAVVIDFTTPDASLNLARVAAQTGTPVVMGTTGLNDAQKAELQKLAQQTPLLWSTNMSVGVNVITRLLPQLATMLGEDYDLEMVEVHHKHKKDSPSGTALTIAETLAEARGWDLNDVACCHREGIIGPRPHEEIGIQAVRGGGVTGVHTVYFLGQGERVEVTHHAHSRENFAMGALRAAKWLKNQRPGRLYSMLDIF